MHDATPMGSATGRRPASFRSGARRLDARDLLWVLLRLAGLLGTTLLMSWGLFVLFFFAIGDFSVDGLMHHLDNLAGRYVAADTERAAAFRRLLAAANLVLLAGILFLRRAAFIRFPGSSR